MMDMRSTTMCSVLRSTASPYVLFPSGRLVDTSAGKVDSDDMEPEVDEGDYLGDLAEEEDGLGVRVSVLGVQWLDSFDF